jgi:hypothetical protein
MLMLFAVFVTTSLVVQLLRLSIRIRRYRAMDPTTAALGTATPNRTRTDMAVPSMTRSETPVSIRTLLFDVRGEPIDSSGRASVERALAALPGVSRVYLSTTTHLLYVQCDTTQELESRVLAALREDGILAAVLHSRPRAAGLPPEEPQ